LTTARGHCPVSVSDVGQYRQKIDLLVPLAPNVFATSSDGGDSARLTSTVSLAPNVFATGSYWLASSITADRQYRVGDRR